MSLSASAWLLAPPTQLTSSALPEVRIKFTPPRCVEWHPSLPLLASASYDDTVRIWSEAGDDDWAPCATLTGHQGTVWGCAWSEDGVLASCSDDRSVIIWSAPSSNTWQQQQRLTDAGRSVLGVAWSPSGLLATASSDNFLRIYQRTGPDNLLQLVARVEAHAGDVNGVAWHPAKRLLATAGDDGLVRIWELNA